MKLGILQVDHVRDPLREQHGDYDVMFMGLFAGQRLDFRIYNAVSYTHLTLPTNREV